MANKGKKYLEARSKVDRNRRYTLEEGIKLLLETAYAKFDEGVDFALRLGVDPKKADQMVRGTVVLPNGTGKKVRARMDFQKVISLSEGTELADMASRAMQELEM